MEPTGGDWRHCGSQGCSMVPRCRTRDCGVPRLLWVTYNDSRFPPWFIGRLMGSAKKWLPEFEQRIYRREDIDSQFFAAHEAILNADRGGGWWLWKPYFIAKALTTIAAGDIVLYTDNRLAFVEDPMCLFAPLLRFDDLVIWRNKPNENAYPLLPGPNATKLANTSFVKRDLLVRYGLEESAASKVAPWAGAMVVRKSARSVRVVNEWLELCRSAHDLTDEPSTIPDRYPIAHRHDQSMLTVIMMRHHVGSHYLPCHALQNTRAPWCGRCRPKITCDRVTIPLLTSGHPELFQSVPITSRCLPSLGARQCQNVLHLPSERRALPSLVRHEWAGVGDVTWCALGHLHANETSDAARWHARIAASARAAGVGRLVQL